MISGSSLEKASDAITQSLTSPIEAYIEEKIKASENELATIEQFSELLTKIHKESGKKVIFIIDELDRARPDFALDLLEKIKHIFSVEGFVFLLVVNREQFEKSIESRYGNINSRLYLNKFIHYWFTLPKISCLSDACRIQNRHSTITRYLLSLDKGNDLLCRGVNLIMMLSYLLEVNDCSLREVERCYSVFAVMENLESINNYTPDLYKVVVGFMAFLKIYDQDLLNKVINKKIDAKETFERLNVNFSESAKISEISLLNHALKYHFYSDEELNDLRDKNILQSAYPGLENGSGRRVYLLEGIFESIEGFQVG